LLFRRKYTQSVPLTRRNGLFLSQIKTVLDFQVLYTKISSSGKQQEKQKTNSMIEAAENKFYMISRETDIKFKGYFMFNY
jgi:hypothetical protein